MSTEQERARERELVEELIALRARRRQSSSDAAAPTNPPPKPRSRRYTPQYEREGSVFRDEPVSTPRPPSNPVPAPINPAEQAAYQRGRLDGMKNQKTMTVEKPVEKKQEPWEIVGGIVALVIIIGISIVIYEVVTGAAG